jgi:hypothetical protein
VRICDVKGEPTGYILREEPNFPKERPVVAKHPLEGRRAVVRLGISEQRLLAGMHKFRMALIIDVSDARAVPEMGYVTKVGA